MSKTLRIKSTLPKRSSQFMQAYLESGGKVSAPVEHTVTLDDLVDEQMRLYFGIRSLRGSK
jgi:hypothetical protein